MSGINPRVSVMFVSLKVHPLFQAVPQIFLEIYYFKQCKNVFLKLFNILSTQHWIYFKVYRALGLAFTAVELLFVHKT